MTRAAKKKTAKKTGKAGGAKVAVSPRNGAQMPTGAHPGNTGGKKGRSGRPTAAFKNAIQMVRDDPKLIKAIELAAFNPESKGFSSALKVITDYDPEKPAQRIMVDSGRLKAMSDDELAAIVAGKR